MASAPPSVGNDLGAGTEPVFLFEIPIGRQRGEDHAQAGDEVAVLVIQSGHALEIHAVPGADHHQRRGDDGDERQQFHDLAGVAVQLGPA